MKTYIFYYLAPGSEQQRYHADTYCTTTANRNNAKRYNLRDAADVDRQFKVVRKNFEYLFKTYPDVSKEIWHDATVDQIKLNYEEYLPAPKQVASK